jgi:hypothetical protein
VVPQFKPGFNPALGVAQFETALDAVNIQAQTGHCRLVPQIVALYCNDHMAKGLKMLVMVIDTPPNIGNVFLNFLQDSVHKFEILQSCSQHSTAELNLHIITCMLQRLITFREKSHGRDRKTA